MFHGLRAVLASHVMAAGALFTSRRLFPFMPEPTDTDAETLEDAFTDVQGVGESRAAELVAIVDAHMDATDGPTLEKVQGLLQQAADAHDEGRHSYAGKYTRRALDAINGE